VLISRGELKLWTSNQIPQKVLSKVSLLVIERLAVCEPRRKQTWNFSTDLSTSIHEATNNLPARRQSYGIPQHLLKAKQVSEDEFLVW
jgi:hypothetical protein